MERVLVASPVRQEPPVLRAFLRSLQALDRGAITLDFAFVDDNDDEASTALLHSFQPGSRVLLLPGEGNRAPYVRNEQTHLWQNDLIWRVARYKDRLLELARQEGYDGIFLVDSDLVLHPGTLRQLMAANVDVISEVFWTRWTPDGLELPQVWLRDNYTLYKEERSEGITHEEKVRRTQAFLSMLRNPGVYEVGGLGACTLISRRALDLGVSFAEIPNISYWGEDRHFCIRAAVLGLRLYVDTHLPALHLYRAEDLGRIDPFQAAHGQMSATLDALQLLRTALRKRGSTHYLTITGREGLAAFTERYRQEAEREAPAVVAGDRQAEAISRLDLLWNRPGDYGPDRLIIQGAALQQGRMHGSPFANPLGFTATLEASPGSWTIADLALEPLATPAPPVPVVRKSRQNRVILAMLVHNEADRYLERVLRHAAGYVDGVLILDDASTDGTADLCRKVLDGVEHQVISLDAPRFHREHELRRIQWELALTMEPDWILCLDADELFEDRMRREIRELVNQSRADAVAFRLYDFWSETHYREDRWWRAHHFYRPFLVRSLPGMAAEWLEADQHCGRFPLAVSGLPTLRSSLRLKHLGWSTAADRQRKYERYMRLDPEGRFGVLDQYRSILDPAPTLIPWQEAEGGAGVAQR